MSEEQKRLLEKQLWAVANALRGKMNADEDKNNRPATEALYLWRKTTNEEYFLSDR